MEKRQFLTGMTGLIAGTLTNSANAVNNRKIESQTILTITGDIERVNRGKSNVMHEILMYKRGIQFSKAYTFTLTDLEKLPSKTISPTMEDDGLVHKLSGPRLVDVLNVVGIKNSKNIKIKMHGIDGYSPEISLALAKKYDFILATRLDGQLLSIGGFGPVFGIYDADRIDGIAQKPLNQRFAGCPWGLYCIEVASEVR